MQQQPAEQGRARPPSPRTSTLVWLWLGYLFFVVYGSLLPFDFTPHNLAEAWQRFQHTHLLDLGIGSRADWVANGVLYLPVSFLGIEALRRSVGRHLQPLMLAGGVTVFAMLLAVAVEFTQIFFPPRTVSLNDILAECLGSVLGTLLAWRLGPHLHSLSGVLRQPSPELKRQLGWLYLVVFAVLSLFPYDVLLSMAELQQKLQSTAWGWLIAGEIDRPVVLLLHLIVECLLCVPIGWLLFQHRPASERGLGAAWRLGLALGLGVELAQFFTASGVSQGASVLTRGLGVALGAWAWAERGRWPVERRQALVARSSPAWLTLYIGLLLYLSQWFGPWLGMQHALEQLRELHFTPLYYHYYTTEALALYSLASTCALYAPLALLAWSRGKSARWAAGLSGLLCLLIETGRLFLPGHADPSNIWIAMISGWLLSRLLSLLSRPSDQTAPSAASAAREPHELRAPHLAPRPGPGLRSGLLGAALLAAALAGLADYPLQPVLLGLLLLLAGVATWLSPAQCLTLLAAALPVLDLAPWSGRLFLDEFDLLLATLIGICYWRLPRAAAAQQRSGRWPLLLLGLSLLIATLQPVWPWPGITADSFNNFLSPFNGVRIAKGALWMLLLWPLLARWQSQGVSAGRQLGNGLIMGLLLTDLVIIWERLAFSGLADFQSEYRVTALISAMHVGGAYIECYLVLGSTFLLARLLQTSSRSLRWAGLGMLGLSSYALAVTYARNGLFAFTLASLVVLALHLRQHGASRGRQWLLALLAAGLMAAAALPVVLGQFTQARMATLQHDAEQRNSHVHEALDLLGHDWAAWAWGIGLGRYPSAELWRSSAQGSHAATFGLGIDGGLAFLRLGAGSPLYVEQFVDVRPGQRYQLRLKLRSNGADAKLSVSLCEKWLLSSHQCVGPSVALERQPPQVWQALTLDFDAGELGGSAWFAKRPVKLVLHQAGPAGHLDLAQLQLLDATGQDLLDNGNFEQGMDRWFFAVDQHLQWHVKSLPGSVLLEQGLLGLAALSLLAGLALFRAVRAAWQGLAAAVPLTAALSGFLWLGLFDTLIDTPRFLLLFLLLCGLSLRLTTTPPAPRHEH